jgi:hypothetical protein
VKPRNREVNIFNMSVLDLLTGALGAFCFLTLALFPSYFKTQKSSASDQHQQLEKTKNGIPPFSLADIGAQDDRGYGCGVFKVDDLQAPHGNKSFRQLPFANPNYEGYEDTVYLFMFDSGSYNLTITAKAYGPPPCRLYVTQHTPQGTPGRNSTLTNSPMRYVFPLEVKPEQLITSILPRR